jgi:hypothetical protein
MAKRIIKSAPELYVPKDRDASFMEDQFHPGENVYFVKQSITTEYTAGASRGPLVSEKVSDSYESTRYALMNADSSYTEEEVKAAVAGFTIRRILGCDILSVLSDGQRAWADSLDATEREAYLESKRDSLRIPDENGNPRLYLDQYEQFGRNEVVASGEDLDFRSEDVARLATSRNVGAAA